MLNPAKLMKLMSAKNKFTNNHPKFVEYLTMIASKGIVEDTILEVTITRPGEAPITSNIKVKQSDLELVEELKAIMK